jgi:hypothetical protein
MFFVLLPAPAELITDLKTQTQPPLKYKFHSTSLVAVSSPKGLSKLHKKKASEETF